MITMDFVGKFSLFLGDFPADTYIYEFSRTKFYCVFAEVTSCHVEKYNLHRMGMMLNIRILFINLWVWVWVSCYAIAYIWLAVNYCHPNKICNNIEVSSIPFDINITLDTGVSFYWARQSVDSWFSHHEQWRNFCMMQTLIFTGVCVYRDGGH